MNLPLFEVSISVLSLASFLFDHIAHSFVLVGNRENVCHVFEFAQAAITNC